MDSGPGRRRLVCLALPAAAAVVMLLAGCGGKATGSGKPGGAPTPSATAPAASPTSSGASPTPSRQSQPKQPRDLVAGPGEIVVHGVITGNLEGCYLTMTDDAGRKYVLAGGDKSVLRVRTRVTVRLKRLPPPSPRDPGVGTTCQASPTHRVLEARRG